MIFLQQVRDTDFFENYNHNGKRVVAKDSKTISKVDNPDVSIRFPEV